MRCILVLATAWCLLNSRVLARDSAFFETRIRPTLAGVCFRCHGDHKASGGLRVDSAAALAQGGESGPALVPGHPEQSLLLSALRREDGVSPMPPDQPLASPIVADFAEWIAGGAEWSEQTAPFRTARHWAFEPLAPLAAAAVGDGPESGHQPAQAKERQSPIDRFLDIKLADEGLGPVERADRGTLIRRATFDLTGLPPTQAEVEAFMADDSPRALDHVVERLLSSPRYGERWGRHWLDVVRYADTAGETADFPVQDAWRYRNYVIRAFNSDKPYDQFLREQIAGDLYAQELAPGSSAERYAELLDATGFISVARRFGFDADEDHYLTIDDTLDMFGKAVLGVTLSCARCHDHKYDPFSMGDYYALYGVFASTRYPFPGCEKKPRPRDTVRLMPPWEYERQVAELDQRLRERAAERDVVEQSVRQTWEQPPVLLAMGQIDNGGAQALAAAPAGAATGLTGGATGLTSGAIGPAGLADVAVHPGEMLALSILPRENQGADTTGVELVIQEQGGERRVWSLAHDMLNDPLAANPHADGLGHAGVWHFCDVAAAPALLTVPLADALKTEGLQVWRGSGDTPSACINSSDQTIRFITVTMPGRSVALHPGPQGGVAVLWRSPIEGLVRIEGRVEDLDAGGGDGIAWRIERRADLQGPLLAAREAVALWNSAQTERAAFEAGLSQAYAVQDGEPTNARLHLRGDPKQLGDEVPRRVPALFGGASLAGNGSGRRELADWLTQPELGLTARVIANRVWQYHFGAGLTSTPNDFGTRGAPPSHPELLDYLAAQLVADGWSLKALHRRIMLSEAYQRSSRLRPESAAIDPDNRYLWRFTRRRLTAEEIRDALLLVCGQLDEQPGGPHPFPPANTWTYTQHNPFSGLYESKKRSVYLMVQRIRREPFFALFDGADASASTGQRFSTTVPTQALYFMNDPFVHQLAAALGEEMGRLDPGQRANAIARRVLAREASDSERQAAGAFVAAYAAQLDAGAPAERDREGWNAWIRVWLASNEFLYVD